MVTVRKIKMLKQIWYGKVLRDTLNHLEDERMGRLLNRHPVLFEKVGGYHKSLDLAGSFVYFCDASVPIVSLCGHIRHIAHPASI